VLKDKNVAGLDWWSTQPIQPGQVPEVTGFGRIWARNEIDHFVLARLAEKKLRPSPEADPRVLVRRLYFDLIGLPPTPEQIEGFLESHRSFSVVN